MDFAPEEYGGYDPTEMGADQTMVLPVILVVDASGSMNQPPTKIGQVNDGARRVLDYLKNDFNDPKTKPMFACLKFSSKSEWVNPNNPYDEPSKFKWQDINTAGSTNFAHACEVLNTVLTTKDNGGWITGRKNCLKPVIIVMSDGGSTHEYDNDLAILKKRGWFDKAFKFGIAIGATANKAMLTAFTGKEKYVLDTDNFNDTSLAEIIKIIVQESSVVSSLDTDRGKDEHDEVAEMIEDIALNGPPGLGEETP